MNYKNKSNSDLINEIKLIKQELEEKDKLLNIITTGASDLIAILDVNGKRIYNSNSYKKILGSPEKFKGTDSFKEIHPGDREKIKDIFKETVRTGKGKRAEYRFVDNHGKIRFLESQGNVIKDENGKIKQVIVVQRDVTECKKAEIELKEDEERFHKFIECSSDGIIIVDSSGTIIEWNRGMTNIVGINKNEAIDKKIWDICFDLTIQSEKTEKRYSILKNTVLD